MCVLILEEHFPNNPPNQVPIDFPKILENVYTNAVKPTIAMASKCNDTPAKVKNIHIIRVQEALKLLIVFQQPANYLQDKPHKINLLAMD